MRLLKRKPSINDLQAENVRLKNQNERMQNDLKQQADKGVFCPHCEHGIVKKEDDVNRAGAWSYISINCALAGKEVCQNFVRRVR